MLLLIAMLGGCGDGNTRTNYTQEAEVIALTNSSVLPECAKPTVLARLDSDLPIKNFISYNNVLYFNGQNASPSQSDYMGFDLVSRTLTNAGVDFPAFSFESIDFSRAAVLDNVLYIPDGTFNERNGLATYDPETDSYTPLPTPEGLNLEPTSIHTTEGILYFGAESELSYTDTDGTAYNVEQSDLWSYNPQSKEYDRAGYDLGYRSAPDILKIDGQHIYLKLGGGALAHYNTQNNEVTVIASVTNLPANVGATTVVLDNQLYYVAREENNLGYVYAYDPVSRSSQILAGYLDLYSPSAMIDYEGDLLISETRYDETLTPQSRYHVARYSLDENKFYQYEMGSGGYVEGGVNLSRIGDYIISTGSYTDKPDLYLMHLPSLSIEYFNFDTRFNFELKELTNQNGTLYFGAPEKRANADPQIDSDVLNDLWAMNLTCGG